MVKPKSSEHINPDEGHSGGNIGEDLRAQYDAQRLVEDYLKSKIGSSKLNVNSMREKLNNVYIDNVRKTNKAVADSMQKIADALDPNKKLKDGYGDPEAFKKAIANYDSSKPSSEQLPNGVTQADIDRFNQYSNDMLQDALKKISENSPQLKKLLEKYPVKKMETPADSTTYDNNINNINKIVEEMDFKGLEENAEQARQRSIEKNGIEPASSSPSLWDSIKKNLKWILFILMAIGAGIVGVEALIAYAEFHSGCQFITCDKGELPVSNKVWCFGGQNYKDGIPQSYNVFKASQDKLYDYNSAQCACASTLDAKVKDCNGSDKEQGSGGEPNEGCCENHSSEEYPSVLAAASSTKCNGDVSIGPPYGFYYWGIMSPLDAAGNVANGAQNYTQHGLKWLVNLLIIVGVVVGVIILLLIIYQYFKNKHPAQAIKVETGSAISKFGNSLYFGNLSRYSNYAYMGRCAAFPAKPHVPLRFKF